LGGRLAGFGRLLGIFALVLLLGSLGSAVFEKFDTQVLVNGLLGQYWYLRIIPETVLKFFAFVVRSYRYYLLVLLGFLGIFYVSARYIGDIYDLDKFSWAVRYLSSLLFGFPYPRITIQDGEKQIPPGEINLLDKIGGPGYLIIQPGSLVLLEGANGTTRVCAEGSNFVSRFEKIREVFNLDDRQGFIESTVATTKDGITIKVRDINYGYRLRTGRVSSDTARQNQDAPYPFSYQAVLNMVFGRSIGTGGLTPWHQMVNLAVEAAITDFIRENLFDDVSAPRFGKTEARIEIARRLNSEGTRFRLRGVGAELLWVDMGHFEVVDKRIEEQRVETWGAKWAGLADVNRAFGDAKRLSHRELGRAEAQAEMILSILSVLNDIDDLESNEDTLRAIVLSRISQLLDGMSERGLLTGGSSDELPPPTQ